jgi:hypothetical protein
VSALAFSLGGYLVARSGFLSMNAAAAWLPWVLWAVERARGPSLNPNLTSGRPEQPRRAQAAIPALAIVLCLQWLAGHAQLSWYTLLLAGAWSICRGAQSRGWRGGLAAAGWFTAAAGLGGLLAAAQLLPTLEYLLQSARSGGVTEGLAFTYSLWPWRLLGLLAPDLFGHPARGDYWGYANYWEDALYLGTLPLLLALGAVITPGARRPGMCWFLTAAGCLSLLLALGDRLPLFPFLFRHVPTFELFQAPTRWSLILVAALCLLAGMGADRWGPPGPRATYWLRLGTVGAGTVVLAAWLAPRLLPGLEPTLAPAVSRAGALLALSGVLALTRPAAPRLGWDAAALTMVLVDLALAGWHLNPSQPIGLQRGQSDLAAQVSDGHRLYMPPELEQSLKFERHFRFDSFQPGHEWIQVRESGLPNTTVLDGLSSANNFDPLLSRRYEKFLEAMQSADPARRALLLDLMDVGWEAVSDAGGVRFQPRPGAARARLVPAAQWVQGAESALLGDDHDPSQVVLLEGAPDAEGSTTGGTGQIGVVDSSDPGRLELRVLAPEGGWAVLQDSWYPGWRAAVDGEPLPIYPADGLFRAVWVPAGEHSVVFTYVPASALVGLVLTTAAWLGMAAVLWRVRRRSPHGQL